MTRKEDDRNKYKNKYKNLFFGHKSENINVSRFRLLPSTSKTSGNPSM